MTPDELDALVLADPGDGEPYLVYADQLQADGDPHGELIAVQVARSRATSDDQRELLQQKADLLLGTIQNSLLGPRWPWLTAVALCQLGWRHGFVRSARIRSRWEHPASAAEVLDALLRRPVARYLEELVVGLPDPAGRNSFADVVRVLVDTGPHPFLARLTLGQVEPDDAPLGDLDTGELNDLWPVLPRLQTLMLRAGKQSLGFVEAPHLREWTVTTCGLTRPAMYRIATARTPALEKLVVYFGEASSGADCSVADLEPLLDRTDLAGLTHLGLCNSEFSDEIPAALAAARILPQLQWVDLSYGVLSDAGAHSLVRHAGRLAHLTLQLHHNHIGPAGTRLLRDAFGDRVSLGAQKRDDPRWHYVSCGAFGMRS